MQGHTERSDANAAVFHEKTGRCGECEQTVADADAAVALHMPLTVPSEGSQGPAIKSVARAQGVDRTRASRTRVPMSKSSKHIQLKASIQDSF